MAGTYKTTFFFEGMQPNVGSTASSIVSWTETWYRIGTSVDEALSFARRVDAGSFLQLRLGFMHALYMCKWVRVSNDAVPGETKLAHVAGSPGGNLGGGTGDRIVVSGDAATAAQINCCVLVDFVSLPTVANERAHHRRVLLRGLPKSMLNGNILSEVGAGFTALLRFCDFIGRGRAPNFPAAGAFSPWLIRFQAPAQVFQPITALATVAGNNRQIIISAALPAAVRGRKVQIRGVSTPRGVNRIWTIMTDSVGGAYTLGRSRFDLAGAWVPGQGQANLITPAYRAADQYTVIGLRTKHTGSSPFGRTRGRRRAS